MTQPDRLREALIAWLDEFYDDQPVVDAELIRRSRDLRYRLVEEWPTPAPDLLAAVDVASARAEIEAAEAAIERGDYTVTFSADVAAALLRAAPSREAGLDVEAVTDAARDMRITAADIYGAIRDLGRAGTRAEAIVFACAEAIAARLSQPTSPAGEP